MEKEERGSVTCLKCGWVSFEVSRKYAEDEAARFNAFFDTLTPEQQQDYYGGKKATITFYEHCMLCGGSYTNFRPSRQGDCPDGCTINPILKRTE